MKEKIIAELKTAYAKLGLSDEAFDGVASLLEKTVKEESEIATAIGGDDVRNLLKTIQGQVDSWKNKFYDARKNLDAYKESHPETKADEDEGDKNEDKPAWVKSLEDKYAAIMKRLDDQDNEERRDAILKAAKESAKAHGCTDERALKLTGKLFSLKENESGEDAAKRFEAEYNANVKDYFGEGVRPYGSIQAQIQSDTEFHKSLNDYANSKFPDSGKK